MKVVAAAVVEDRKLLVVSKQAAPDVFTFRVASPRPENSPKRPWNGSCGKNWV